MRRKSIVALALTATMTISMSMTAFAGYWYVDRYEDWYYMNDDGTYPTNGWYWINEKCYYFKDNVICKNTTTPDGYTVDKTGAWTVNGVVQTKAGENLDYCKNIQKFGELGNSPVVISQSVTDCGDYYDVVGEIYSSFPEEGLMLPNAVAHIRVRKSANVHWKAYSDSARKYTTTEISMEEYANEQGGNNSLAFVRMVDGIVQDSEGYVVAFTDLRGN